MGNLNFIRTFRAPQAACRAVVGAAAIDPVVVGSGDLRRAALWFTLPLEHHGEPFPPSPDRL